LNSNTLEKQEIVNEWTELLKLMKAWLDLGRFKSEVMTALNVSTFEDLPRSVQRYIAVRHAALVPAKQIAARKAALAQLQQEILDEEIARLPGWRDCVN
jgi:hypothetical protein